MHQDTLIDAPGDERLALLRQWIVDSEETRRATLETASDDASFRRYFRVRADGKSWIAMDAPPPMEDCRPFVDIAGRLRDMSLNAPEILRADLERGFLLMADLGDTTYLGQIQDSPGRLNALYDDAIDALVMLQQRGVEHCADLPPYDEALLRRELGLFHDWLCEKHLGLRFTDTEEQRWAEACDRLVANALEQQQVFVHRDYHSRNLMVRPEMNPGIIDFQDAVYGPQTYDLVSLLKDCYYRLDPADIERGIERFIEGQTGDLRISNSDRFRDELELMGIQRHLKAAGIFARLNHRDGKSRYLQDVPVALDYIVNARSICPEIDWLREFVEQRVLPALVEAGP